MQSFTSQSDPAPDAPVIPGYIVGRMLGSGAMAQVWLVTRVDSNDIFAAKVIGERTDELTETLNHELHLQQHLQHQHLVQVYGVQTSPGHTVLLMDYAAGGSLAALVNVRGPLPLAEVVTIMTPIAGCVAYLHAKGVMHADLAPGNILFTEDGKPLLADLGLSRMAGERRNQYSGTAGFADPYQSSAGVQAAPVARDRSESEAAGSRLSPGSDVYALGALTWFALTGRVPARTYHRPPLSMMVPDVPSELALLIEAALEPEASQRPTAADFERTVFRSTAAAPVDLVEAVHESVLPKLLTRRDLRKDHKGRGRLPRLRPRLSGWANRLRGRSVISPLVLGFTAVLLAALAVLAAQVVLPVAGSTPPPLNLSTRSDGSPTADSSPPAAAPPAGKSGAVPERISQELKSPSPAVAARALAGLRSYALSSGELGLLEEVNAAGSPAMEADKALADRLRSADQRLAGLEMSLPRVRVLPGRSASTARVSATVLTSAYQLRSADGPTVRTTGSTEQELVVALRWQEGKWLIDRILAPAAGS